MRTGRDEHLEEPTFGTLAQTRDSRGYLFAPRHPLDEKPWLGVYTNDRFKHSDIWSRVNDSGDKLHVVYDPRIDFEDGES